jgi:CBS domain
MPAGGFRHLPVIEGNTPVGIVSLRDLLSGRIRRRPTRDGSDAEAAGSKPD